MMSTVLKIGKTKYLLWYGEKPNLKHIRVFGCVAYTHIPDRDHKNRQEGTEIKVYWLYYNIYQLQSLGWWKAQVLCSSWCYLYFRKSTNTNELELENLKKTVAKAPIESEKEESDEEKEEQPEPLRCF